MPRRNVAEVIAEVSRMSLVDGLAALENYDDKLTECACWHVRFEHYSFRPVLVVPFDTSLDLIEALGRRNLFDHLTREGPDGWMPTGDYAGHSAPEEYYAEWAAKVATLKMLSIKRMHTVALDPTIG